MKWYEVSYDCGDDTTVCRRFRTFEDAQTWRDGMENVSWWVQDGDGSPVIEVDTESRFFFTNPEEYKEYL